MVRYPIRGLGIVLLLAGLPCATAPADTIVIRSREHKGQFEGYANNQFQFKTDGWTQLQEPRTSVQKLVMEPPCEAVLVQGAKEEIVTLVGYEQPRFIVERKGVRQDVSGMLVKSLTVRRPTPKAADGAAEAPRPRRSLDIAGLEQADLTPDQTAALERYKAARARYDAFLRASSEMVAEMDTARGPRREELLNALRTRKIDEQPILRALEDAERALAAAIPPGPLESGKPAAANPAGHPSDARAAKVVPPAIGNDEVVLIDVSGLDAGPDLPPAQREAIAGYQKAADSYVRLANHPECTETELAAAAQRLRAAQTVLLERFPDMTLTGD